MHRRYAQFNVNKGIGVNSLFTKHQRLSPMHPKPKQRRQKAWDDGVAPSVISKNLSGIQEISALDMGILQSIPYHILTGINAVYTCIGSLWAIIPRFHDTSSASSKLDLIQSVSKEKHILFQICCAPLGKGGKKIHIVDYVNGEFLAPLPQGGHKKIRN